MLLSVIDADNDAVFLARQQVFPQLKIMRCTQALVVPCHLSAVNPHLRMPDDTLQSEQYLLVLPAPGNDYLFPVPGRPHVIKPALQVEKDLLIHSRFQFAGYAITGIAQRAGESNFICKWLIKPLLLNALIQTIQHHFPFTCQTDFHSILFACGGKQENHNQKRNVLSYSHDPNLHSVSIFIFLSLRRIIKG